MTTTALLSRPEQILRTISWFEDYVETFTDEYPEYVNCPHILEYKEGIDELYDELRTYGTVTFL